MKKMKADATSIGIKNRISQQMVQVDQICASDNKACTAPFVTPNKCREQKRRNPMTAVVQDWLEKLYASIQSRKKL